MKVTLLPTCRIGLLAAFLSASFPEAGLASLTGSHAEGAALAGARSKGVGSRMVFRLSSTPLASSRGG